jgi:hypothetical protein
MLKSPRVCASTGILDSLRSNPYLKGDEASTVAQLLGRGESKASESAVLSGETQAANSVAPAASGEPATDDAGDLAADDPGGEVPDEAVSAYLAEHSTEIAQQQEKPFQPVGGIVDLLGAEYLSVVESKDITEKSAETAKAASGSTGQAAAVARKLAAATPQNSRRDNSLQKINRLDVKGRIQLAMKGNKEERSILIRDGTKVVALAVLDAPKLSDGEVEKFALQKNVLEAVLRQIPLKRRFMKNYIVVRNLVSNPRTPLDLGLGLMKHLLIQDLKNISGNKEVSETVRKLALKMYKQKVDAANKK